MHDKKYVVFSVGKEQYAVSIDQVERILQETEITPIPKAPKMLLGIFDMRGETVPVIDLRRRFEMEDRADTGNFVVVESKDGCYALRTDRVEGIVESAEEALDKKSLLKRQKNDQFILGVLKSDAGLVVVLDPEELMPPEVKKKLAA